MANKNQESRIKKRGTVTASTAKQSSKTATRSIAELRQLSVAELQKQLTTSRADLLALQKSLKAGELANPHAVTKLRREVAQILTIITEKSPTRQSQESTDNVIPSNAKDQNDKSKKGAK